MSTITAAEFAVALAEGLAARGITVEVEASTTVQAPASKPAKKAPRSDEAKAAGHEAYRAAWDAKVASECTRLGVAKLTSPQRRALAKRNAKSLARTWK